MAHGTFLQREGCSLLVHRARRRQHNNFIINTSNHQNNGRKRKSIGNKWEKTRQHSAHTHAVQMRRSVVEDKRRNAEIRAVGNDRPILEVMV